MKTKIQLVPSRKVLTVLILIFVLLFSLFGTGDLPSARAQESITSGSQPASAGASTSVAPVADENCPTYLVFVTLNSEQISFCAPSTLSSNVVEDNLTDPGVAYAQFNQLEGYGSVNIKSIALQISPGAGRPVYDTSGAVGYREAVWNIESSKSDRVISSGPVGMFWNELVPSIQIDASIATSQGTMNILSTEWYVEHNSRLWSFTITWNTALSNAAEWVGASNRFAVQTPNISSLSDTAIDLGADSSEPKASQSTLETLETGTPIDVSMPAWWSGTCNDNNYFTYTGIHSAVLGSSWHGVPPCGPRPYTVPNQDHPVAFFAGAHQELEFECVELVMRFLYQEWGIAPWAGNGNQIKNSYPTNLMVFYPNGSRTIVPGDILTENASVQNSAGHTAIITSVNLDGNGTGNIGILEQNTSPTGNRSLHVSSWSVDPDPYAYSQTIQGWLHVIANENTGGGGGPSGYTFCANESGYCSFSGTADVAYGANGSFNYKYGVTNGINCDNNTFGDPINGVSKACYYKLTVTPPVCNPNSDQIAFFEHANYSGTCKVLGVGDYSNPSTMGFPNDTASSVKVGSNVVTTLYENDNYSGASEQFTGDDSDLSNNTIGNDRVSSVKVQWRSCNPNSDQIALYAGTSYTGTCVTLGIGEYANPGYLGPVGNDNAESIRVGSNVTAFLCENDNYQGTCSTLSNDDINLGSYPIGGNRASSVKVQSRAPNAPTLITPLIGSSFNEGDTINLSWSATGNEYFGEVMGGPGGTLSFGWQTGTSKNIGSQWAGYSYTWHVKARNGTSESGWSSQTWSFTVYPGTPSNLQASPVSCSQINLSWSDNSGNEDGYKVYRNGSLISTLGSNITSYQDPGLTGNANYSYTVKAYRGNIESNSSNTATATTTACATIPNTPANFRVSGSTQTSITIAWDDVSGETGYKIYRWGYDGTQWTFIYLDSVGASITSYTQNNLDCGSDFNYYEVSAYNGNGESQHAGWIQGITLPCAFSKTLPANGALNQPLNLTLSWESSTGATSYEYCYDTTNDNACSNWTSNGTSTSVALSALSVSTPYYWQVRAINSSGATYANGSNAAFWPFTTQNNSVSCPATINNWKGEYWTNPSLTGTSTVCRDDTDVNFDWALGSPDPLIPSDSFSARWTRTVSLSSGTYRFYMRHDDGARLFIDDMNNPVLDKWPTCCVVDTLEKTLAQGNHVIKVEYFENGGAANVHVWWEPLSTLTVNKTGTGSGVVTSDPAGIDCGSTCSYAFPNSTSITLTATAATGSSFTGWNGGGCSGIGICTVNMAASTSVTANFNLNPTNTGLLNPSSNLAQATGDQNGYEVNPANAYANDSLFAVDNNSGSGTSTSCTDKKKDNHVLYNYGISVPAGTTVQGIEVQLDAKVDSTSGSPKICVQLSWNGGSSWTTAKTTGTLTTGEQTFTLGGPTDTWGHAWTTSQLSNTNFRVRIIDVASDTSRDFSLDRISVRVTYR